MPLQTKEIQFEAERERLREQMEEIAEKQVEWEGDEERAQQLLVQGNELNNRCNILERMGDEWGVESVTLAGLTAGEINLVEDIVEHNDGVNERDAWVAVGTHDAPYLEHDPDNRPESPGQYRQQVMETVAEVVSLPLAYVRWAEGKISELSHLDEATGNSYLELVREKQQQEKSTAENG